MVGRLLLMLVVVACIFALPVGAEEVMPDFSAPMAEFYAAIPDDLRQSLPEALFGEAMPDGELLGEASSPSALIERVRVVLCEALPEAGRRLGQICLCLLFAALFDTVCTAYGTGDLSGAAQLLGRLCSAALLLGAQMGQIELITACLRQMRLIMGAMLPLMGAILAAGGNAGTAASGCGSLLVFLNLGENLCTSVFLPLIAASSGLAAVAGLPSAERLRGLTACLKRVTHWSIGLFGAVFSAVMAAQTVLAAGADSVASRTVKFAVGSAVPIIGGVVGDAVRTLAAGVGYLKDTVGLLGIFLLFLLALPPLCGIVLHRAVLILGSAVAELLGCSGEKRLLEEFTAVSGSLLAVLAVSLLCFVFSLLVFVRVAPALGG